MFIVALFFILFPAAAEEAVETFIERTIFIFDPVDMSDPSEAIEPYSLHISDTLSLTLENSGYTVIQNQEIRRFARDEYDNNAELTSKDKILELAAALGADVAVNGMYWIEDGNIYIGIRAYDIFTGLVATAVTKAGRAGPEFYNTVEEAANIVAEKARENLQPLPESVITVQREKIKVERKIVEEIVSIGEEVTVIFSSADEGAELYLGGEQYIGTIEDGELEYSSKTDSTLSIVIRKENYHDHRQEFNLGSSEERITLQKLYRKSDWDFGLQVYSNEPYGAAGVFRRHIIADRVLFHMEGGFFYIPSGYHFTGNELTAPGYLLHVRSAFGFEWYPIFAPRSPFRFSFTGGFLPEWYWSFQSGTPLIMTFSFLWGQLRLEFNRPRSSYYIFGGGNWGSKIVFTSQPFDIHIDHASMYSAFLGVGVTWKK